MGRWVELATTSFENGKSVHTPSGRFIDLDRAGFVAVIQQTDQHGAPADSWVVRTDQGALVGAEFGSEGDARTLLGELIPIVEAVSASAESAGRPDVDTTPGKPAVTRKRAGSS